MLLPDFTRDDLYETLRVTLWPADDKRVEGELALAEPPVLLNRIDALLPNDRWLVPSKNSDSDVMDVDDPDDESEGADPNIDKDVDEGPAEIRYINLYAHEIFAIDKLGEEVTWHDKNAMFVIRHEYGLFMEHAMRRLSHPPNDSYRGRFFVTGKSLGCYYFLFRLLAMGQSVFLLDALDSVYYFSQDGVQATGKGLRKSAALYKALRSSWVLIDVDDRTNWTPALVFTKARCVIWTSSPRKARMMEFVKRFGAETWYMKAWSLKEVAAVTERLGIKRADVLERLNTGGPVARCLWGGLPPPSSESIDEDIKSALQSNIFNFTPMDVETGVQPIHRLYLVQPLVVFDEKGRPRLQRTDYSAEFISGTIFHKILFQTQRHLEKVQSHLAAALDIASTRSVAGKVFEGIMHRALNRGMQLPAVFGPGTIVGSLMLYGKAEDFVRETDANDIANKRPLYLQPESLNFAAVDAILVTNNRLGLIQVSLSSSHPRHFGTMLRIMSRLPRGAQVDVRCLDDVIYCLVGIDPETVQELMAEADRTLAKLKTLDAKKLSKELGLRHTQIAHTRLSTFRVFGYTFDYKMGFTEVQQ
ncbi:hypothetical protein GGX14DRAFT_398071 [Mycena pura]|uniref:Uncharacterized protein n=1 Tax=Mycena pura TaxID=153505 RepID=A0AAD6V6Y2_9AGAR|nr:hypothetical protein GGX14DRAFT_398071 [Mycena pura]